MYNKAYIYRDLNPYGKYLSWRSRRIDPTAFGRYALNIWINVSMYGPHVRLIRAYQLFYFGRYDVIRMPTLKKKCIAEIQYLNPLMKHRWNKINFLPSNYANKRVLLKHFLFCSHSCSMKNRSNFGQTFSTCLMRPSPTSDLFCRYKWCWAKQSWAWHHLTLEN